MLGTSFCFYYQFCSNYGLGGYSSKENNEYLHNMMYVGQNNFLEQVECWGPDFNLNFELNVQKVNPSSFLSNIISFQTTQKKSSEVPGIYLTRYNHNTFLGAPMESRKKISRMYFQ